MEFDDASMNALINGLKYKNLSETLTPGARVFTLTQVEDSGGTGVWTLPLRH
jgi:hypothetical protein